jgi:anti-anti-sigma regulatory factor
MIEHPPCPPSPAVILAPEMLDHAAAPSLARTLAGHRGAPVRIDASVARFLGGQSLQILLAAARAWRAERTAFDLINFTPELAEQSRLLGVDLELLAQGELPQ